MNHTNGHGSQYLTTTGAEGSAMDEYQIMSLLERIQPGNADPSTVARLYAETLAAISDHISDDQMRRFLICGAYLCNKAKETATDPDSVEEYYSFTGAKRLH
ncbi:hypothetical protein [Noviherbaspirillum malthae]|uniref:hypothetical protein n=1 Tax=Noviherbaspirillum malthae TaxID=1260987 RepID=UPI00188FD560|nr:hypothetical protein [Noviherbaspirillum malthae]